MPLTNQEVADIAHLARLEIEQDKLAPLSEQLSNILHLADTLAQIDTDDIEPMSHPLGEVQRLRDDVVTEHNQRDVFQSIAPKVEQAMYLVPKVIE